MEKPGGAEVGSAGRGAWAGLVRVVDANQNRACEALRVADDLARFVLDDQGLCGEFKAVRHGLVAAVGRLLGGGGEGVRLAARDTEGDVGTVVSGAGEYGRRGAGGVAQAACGRLAEALRSIEEAAKVLPGGEGVAREVEGLRYRSYTAGARLVLRLGGGLARQWRLCVLVTEALCEHHPWERVAELAIAGGADCLQLREKSLDSGELLARARRLVGVAAGNARDGERASVVVNDRPDIALLAGADGVHVGQTDLPVAEVRRLAGFALAVGVSTSGLEQARRARAEGADSVGLGPMFVSGTKPKPALAGVEYLRAFLADGEVAALPHLAISGITPANVGELWAAGCRGVAVSAVVCGADRPEEVCRALLAGRPG